MAVSAIKAGAHDFFEKPFDADEVVARVRDAIAARRRREQGAAGSKLRHNFPGPNP